ncbi:hypothetical protein [Pseudonocardia sp. TRM90224]|uniref:hypothetical protein n=1 Tax=Pseudonocardia sp. TRM90224 TaxID=2812678 RepID=UPI001E3857CC|nr:hypothetical protein [Pseudonocardia sp. TRM90224]
MTGPTDPAVRLHVEAPAVASVAAHRARLVPGVVALRPGGVGATVQGGAAEVALTLVTRLGHNCRDLAVAVQREVTNEIADVTGLAAVVTVTIADVLTD